MSTFDEFGPSLPTIESINVAKDILRKLASSGFEIPPAQDSGFDHDGCWRMVWECGAKTLELVIPHTGKAGYLYHSDEADYGVQRDLTTEALRERFAWLVSHQA